MGRTANARARAHEIEHDVPGPWRRLAERASRHHVMTLAAGLAFFGIVSIGPAVAFAFGVMRLTTSPEVASSMVDSLQAGYTETLGLGDLLDQMEDQAGRYAGFSLLVLLWPATTMASGWTRALDAVNDDESGAGLRGIRGRLRGLLLGGVLLAGMLGLLGAVTAGRMLIGEAAVALAVAVAVATVWQFVLCLLIYRLLPTTRRGFGMLWRGALGATAGIVAVTVVFGLLLAFADDLAEQYPASLSTAIVLGLWFYGANVALLLGGEYNAEHASRT